MATIQIRNVPDKVHLAYQMKAAAAGMSLQQYLLAELEQNAEMKSPAQVVREVRERMRAYGTEGFSLASSVEAIREDRDSH